MSRLARLLARLAEAVLRGEGEAGWAPLPSDREEAEEDVSEPAWRDLRVPPSPLPVPA